MDHVQTNTDIAENTKSTEIHCKANDNNAKNNNFSFFKIELKFHATAQHEKVAIN